MITRRKFIASQLASVATVLSAGAGIAAAPATAPRPIRRPVSALAPGEAGLKALIAKANLRGDVICAVADAQSGQLLEETGANRQLPPASVAKALTALFALDVLGAAHRFKTRVVATGPIEGGVLNGDLVLLGGGDPTLDTDALAALADKLKQAGLREVRGGFQVWDGALPFVRSIDPGQPDQVGYSPAISGLALNYNRVHFEWKRANSGWAVTMDARTKRYRPNVTSARMTLAQRSAPVYTYEARGGIDHWSVATAALGKGGARWLPVRNPALYVADVFATLCRSHGIKLGAAKQVKSAPTGQLLAQHQSDTLPVLLKSMLKYSNNLMAEMIGMSASARLGETPKALDDSAARMNRWAASTYGMRDCRMVDHSGLGDKSRLSAADLVRALSVASRSGVLRPLLKPVHLRDAQGQKMHAHPVKVAAKTGTLNFVSGLGGFLTTEDGRELVFAIFSADMKARAGIKRAERERPPGARSWNTRAKRLQQQLLKRWGQVYAT